MACYGSGSAEFQADTQSAPDQDAVVRMTEVDSPIPATGPSTATIRTPAPVCAGRNPFVQALWFGGSAMAVLSILVTVLAAYRDLGQGFSTGTSAEGMPLLYAVQPFALPGMVLGVAGVMAALIFHAFSWEIRHRGR